MIAYNEITLQNLELIKLGKQWKKSGLIEQEQLDKITSAHEVKFYHPNIIVRILLFIATAIVLSAITGLLVLAVMDSGERVISTLSIIYGIISLWVLDQVFIRNNNHYKSGITEALLYHSLLFIFLGCIDSFQGTPEPYALLGILLFGFVSYRYLDLISTAGAILSLALLIFLLLFRAGGVMQQIIPIVIIIAFTPLYFFIRKSGSNIKLSNWKNNLILIEAVCLLLIYAAGNYLVVRELSIQMMRLELNEGEDIPLSWLFYGLTILIPIIYLYFGITLKDLVLIRVSLVVIAFTAFTFKWYYGTGHHEITFTVSGFLLLISSVSLLRWLKTPKGGYTRENILNEKWANSNAQAFLVSQTLGVSEHQGAQQTNYGGGESGGGGSNSTF